MALASSWDKELAFESAAGDQPVALQPRDLRGTWNSSAFGTLVMRCYTRGDGPRAGERVAPRERRKSDDWYGAYRYHDGVVTGRLAADGVFRGWWLEQPRKVANRKAATGARAEQHRTVVNGGAFAWRGVRRAGEKLIVGCWIYGRSGRADPDKAYDVHPGWDLVPLATDAMNEPGDLVTGALDEPRDLAARFSDIDFRQAPHVPRARPTVHDCAHRALSPDHVLGP
ncbi:MAG: hypothetical protein ACRDKY_00385 [Solirubrobacteraceae bacterium]